MSKTAFPYILKRDIIVCNKFHMGKKYLTVLYYWYVSIVDLNSVNLLRNEFHFSEVYRSVNYIGSRAK